MIHFHRQVLLHATTGTAARLLLSATGTSTATSIVITTSEKLKIFSNHLQFTTVPAKNSIPGWLPSPGSNLTMNLIRLGPAE